MIWANYSIYVVESTALKSRGASAFSAWLQRLFEFADGHSSPHPGITNGLEESKYGMIF
jgi:hypothetical protein